MQLINQTKTKKIMKPTQNLITAAQNLLAAQATAQTVAAIVVAYQQEILNANSFEYDQDEIEAGATGFVKDVKGAYMMSREAFAKYDALNYERALAAGFNVAPGFCPKLIAESALRDAELTLVNLIADEQNLPALKNMANPTKRREAAELALRYVAPYIDKVAAKHALLSNFKESLKK